MNARAQFLLIFMSVVIGLRTAAWLPLRNKTK